MESNNFAVFILTHGRPDNVVTVKTLRSSGYAGDIYFIVDNEDKTADKYIKNFGIKYVKIFDKKAMADKIDEGNNFDERKCTVHARNACFKIARDIGFVYFIMLEDDYLKFDFRINSSGNYPTGKFKIRTRLNVIFNLLIDYYKSIDATSIAIAQGGDFIGGGGPDYIYKFKRKAMNSFICSTDREFSFLGQLNDDVNTYVTRGNRGQLFFTISFLSLTQEQTQGKLGGMSDAYKKYGTYCKSFTTVLMHPSGVRVSMMNTENSRLHHSIKWLNTVPVILNDKYKKDISDRILPEIEIPDSIKEVLPEIEDDVYIVSYSYDIYLKETCLFNPRFTGTYKECERFIAESKQPTLF